MAARPAPSSNPDPGAGWSSSPAPLQVPRGNRRAAWGPADLVLAAHFLLLVPFLQSGSPGPAASELGAHWDGDGAPALRSTAAAPASQPILGVGGALC